MPRQARLDAAGTLHHVIIRGIEKRRIVDDDPDRREFASHSGRQSRGFAQISRRLRDYHSEDRAAGWRIPICHFKELGAQLFQLVNNVPVFLFFSVAFNQRMRLFEICRVDCDHCFCQQSDVDVGRRLGDTAEYSPDQCSAASFGTVQYPGCEICTP
jgi:hypothetical protein